MEGKFQEKGKVEDDQTELHDRHHILQRPQNFSFERRNKVYYFSDDSPRGILKCVPVKNGSYNLSELKTVFEKSAATKIQNEIWSDIPLNSTEDSNVDKNGTVDKNGDSYELVHHGHKNEKALKSINETARKLQSLDLKKHSILKACKEYQKTKNDNKKSVKLINPDQDVESFPKPFKLLMKKRYLLNSSVPNNSENFKASVLDEKSEKLSTCNIRSISSKKSEECNHNNESLSEARTESSLNDALKIMSKKIPVTEL